MGLSDKEVAELALGALNDANKASVAVSVALAENRSKDPRVVSATGDVGIWQINLAAHPQYSKAWLQVPSNNAQAMAVISKSGTDWSPWMTYQKGKHKQYSERAGQAVADVLGLERNEVGRLAEAVLGIGGAAGVVSSALGGSPLDPVREVAKAVADFANVLGDFFEWVSDPNTWRRTALIVAGGAIVVVGAAAIMRGTETGQTVEGVVKTVATKGAAGGKTGAGPMAQRKERKPAQRKPAQRKGA